MAQTVRNLPAMPETRVQSLVQKDLLEKGRATLSSTLARRIPWTEEPGGRYQKDGAQAFRAGGLLRRGRENFASQRTSQGKARRTRLAGSRLRAGERPQGEPAPGTPGLESWEDATPVFKPPGHVLPRQPERMAAR